MEKGLRTCLTCGQYHRLTGVFLAGAGVGYFTPQLFKISVPSGPAICPPCLFSGRANQYLVKFLSARHVPTLILPVIRPKNTGNYLPLLGDLEIVHEDFVDQQLTTWLTTAPSVSGCIGR